MGINLSQLASAVDASDIQLAEPRFAGKVIGVTPEDIKKYTQKYEDMDRDRSLPNYIGRSEADWKDDNTRIRSELIQMDKMNASVQDARDYLTSQGFQIPQEQDNILRYLDRNNKRGRLHTEAISVPHANSDELLSRAVMSHSGWNPVTPANQDIVMATDVRAEIDNIPYLIDAQSRNGSQGELNLAVAHNSPGITDALRGNKSTPLIDFLNARRLSSKGMFEGKLLHTPDDRYNPIQSQRFMRDQSNQRKDFLISSNRAGNSIKGMRKGPYNPELPRNWALVDLEMARDQLLRKNLSQLEAAGYRLGRFENDALSLVIPASKLQNFQNTSVQIPSEVNEALRVKNTQVTRRPGQRRSRPRN